MCPGALVNLQTAVSPNPLVHQSVLGSRCWACLLGPLALGSLASTPGLSGSRLVSLKSPRRHTHIGPPQGGSPRVSDLDPTQSSSAVRLSSPHHHLRIS